MENQPNKTSLLFSKFQLRDLVFKNRIFMSPMCQYSSENGMPNDWHLVHLGSRAVGGAGAIIVEATAVSPEGRITPDDSGIWTDAHAQAFQRITRFIRGQNCVPGIQLAHAGRKASTDAPWRGDIALSSSERGWIPVAPSAIAFDDESPTPKAMDSADISKVLEDFKLATRRSLDAGFEVVEIHMAHGYLLHEFLSPLSNQRNDEYGGNFENRTRLPLEVASAVREIWPSRWPVFVRISATDWVEGGWDLPQSIRFCRLLKGIGIDLIDCSSGGLTADAKIPAKPGYQLPFADAIRKEAQMATGAVGLITKAENAEEIITSGQADAIFLARELLRRPYWPLHTAHKLGVPVAWPKQYERGKIRD